MTDKSTTYRGKGNSPEEAMLDAVNSHKPFPRILRNASPSPPPSAGVDAVAQKVDDMAMLIRLLVRNMEPGLKIREAALDYLRRNDLMGSPFREASAITPAPTPVEAGGEAVLPELPVPTVTYADHSYPAFSAKQMKAYALDALAKPAPAVEAVREAELAAQIAARDSNGCGCAWGWETVFCDDPRLPEPDTECQCKKDASAAVKAYAAALAPAAQAGTVAQEGER